MHYFSLVHCFKWIRLFLFCGRHYSLQIIINSPKLNNVFNSSLPRFIAILTSIPSILLFFFLHTQIRFNSVVGNMICQIYLKMADASRLKHYRTFNVLIKLSCQLCMCQIVDKYSDTATENSKWMIKSRVE